MGHMEQGTDGVFGTRVLQVCELQGRLGLASCVCLSAGPWPNVVRQASHCPGLWSPWPREDLCVVGPLGLETQALQASLTGPRLGLGCVAPGGSGPRDGAAGPPAPALGGPIRPAPHSDKTPRTATFHQHAHPTSRAQASSSQSQPARPH